MRCRCGGIAAAVGVTAVLAVTTLAALAAAAHKLDLIDDDLEFAAALAVALPGAVTELAFDRNLRPLGEIAAHGLGTGAEHRAVHEVGVILPIARLRVLAAIVDGNAKRKHLRAAGGCAQLGIAREVTGNVHSIDAHADSLPLGCGRLDGRPRFMSDFYSWSSRRTIM